MSKSSNSKINNAVQMNTNTKELQVSVNMSANVVHILSCIIITIIIIGLIMKYAYKNDKPVCTDYIFNSYLYIILTICIMLIIIIINNETNIFTAFMILLLSGGKMQTCGIIILIFVILIYSFRFWFPYINPEETYKLHFAYILLTSFIAITLCFFKFDIANALNNPASVFIMLSDILVIGGIWTIAIVIIVGLVCNNYIDILQQFEWNFYAKHLLFAFIVYCLVGVIFITDSDKLKFFISVGVILGYILLIVMLIDNHINIVSHSKICGNPLMPLPNYPLEGLGLVMRIRRYITDLLLLFGTYGYNNLSLSYLNPTTTNAIIKS